jgi:hypothetical protein
MVRQNLQAGGLISRRLIFLPRSHS